MYLHGLIAVPADRGGDLVVSAATPLYRKGGYRPVSVDLALRTPLSPCFLVGAFPGLNSRTPIMPCFSVSQQESIISGVCRKAALSVSSWTRSLRGS